jgi:hypothetical protein
MSRKPGSEVAPAALPSRPSPAGVTLEEAACHVCMSVSAFTSYQRRGIIPRYPPGEVDLDHVRYCVLRHLEIQVELRRGRV